MRCVSSAAGLTLPVSTLSLLTGQRSSVSLRSSGTEEHLRLAGPVISSQRHPFLQQVEACVPASLHLLLSAMDGDVGCSYLPGAVLSQKTLPCIHDQGEVSLIHSSHARFHDVQKWNLNRHILAGFFLFFTLYPGLYTYYTLTHYYSKQ